MKKLLIFLLLLSALPAWSQTTKNGRVQTGTNALKPATCSAGDQYNAIDTFQILICGPANTWAASGGSGTPASPTNSVQTNNAGVFGGSANFLFNSSGRSEVAVGPTAINLIDVGASGYSFKNPTASADTFGFLEAQSADGGFALQFYQAGRNAGGVGVLGSTAPAPSPGAMEIGVWGIVDPTVTTEFLLIPDSGTVFSAPTGNNFINFTGPSPNIFPAKHGQMFWDDVANTFYMSDGDNVAFSASWALNGNNGTAELAVGDGNILTDVSATGNWTFPANLKSATLSTATDCKANGTAASPSVVSCSAASAGMFSCATNASTATCQVNSTAVTANSEIFITQDAADGGASQLNVTCNTTNVLNTSKPLLVSKSAGVSFTINLGTVTTNPACFEYYIVN